MNEPLVDLSRYETILNRIHSIRINGKVIKIIGLMVQGNGPAASIGEVCGIVPVNSDTPVEAEVVGFKNGRVLLMPLESIQGLGPGCKILSMGHKAGIGV